MWILLRLVKVLFDYAFILSAYMVAKLVKICQKRPCD